MSAGSYESLMDGRTGEVRMLSITENARSKLDEFAEQAEETELAVKVAITGRGPKGFQYDLQLVPPSEAAEGDVVTEVDGLTVIIAEKSAAYLDGATLDFVETLMGPGGFQFENPNPLWLDPLAQRVADVLDEEVNPAVASHGGNVTLIDVVEGEAIVEFGGGCQGCSAVDVTLKHGVETMLMEKIPEIVAVVDITDHAAGTNPFY
ncbi:MAG: iron-sulfur cluster assembly accessory protein [Candidatus Poseidoniales archaeon]|nr:iron-sulfur cluster assembly accessory protein [Candidatus Poseidoniales archaeon]